MPTSCPHCHVQVRHHSLACALRILARLCVVSCPSAQQHVFHQPLLPDIIDYPFTCLALCTTVSTLYAARSLLSLRCNHLQGMRFKLCSTTQCTGMPAALNLCFHARYCALPNLPKLPCTADGNPMQQIAVPPNGL